VTSPVRASLRAGVRTGAGVQTAAAGEAVADAEQAAPIGRSGVTVWLTGLPSAGKTTLARAAAEELTAAGRDVQVLDGDEVRETLSRDLGFSRADRDTQVLRTGYVARLLALHGVTVLAPVIAPYGHARAEVRAQHEQAGIPFVEVHVAAPVEVCAERDVKGLYARQRAGEISHLTGVDDPYEAPPTPELRVDTDRLSLIESTRLLVSLVLRDAA